MIQYRGDQAPGGPRSGVTLGAAGGVWLRTNEMWINNSTVAELTLTRELRRERGPSRDEGLRREAEDDALEDPCAGVCGEGTIDWAALSDSRSVQVPPVENEGSHNVIDEDCVSDR